MRENWKKILLIFIFLFSCIMIFSGSVIHWMLKEKNEPQHYNDEKRIERNLKLTRINHKMVYDSVTKVVYWNNKCESTKSGICLYLDKN